MRDAAELERAEADITRVQIALLQARPIAGQYDLEHLQAFHRFIFSGIYDWAGETRTVNISKTHLFCPAPNITAFAAGTFARLAGQRHLRGLDRDRFVAALAEHLGEVN